MRRPKHLGIVVALCVTTTFAAAAATQASSAPQATNYTVALLTTGATNNRSWANAWSDGAKRACKQFKCKLTVVGNLDAPDQYVSQGSAFASKGTNLIIMAHGAMQSAAVKLAKQFPNTQIVQFFEFPTNAAQIKSEPANVGHVDAEQQYGAFLAGALAGMMTKTGKIAAVYAFPFPALTRQPEAFNLGAKCVNPNVQFTQKQTNSFTDAAAARAAASSLISDGADVVFAAVDQAVQGVIQAANTASQKTYAIPSYYDDHSLGPKVVLTSVLYNLQGVAYDIIQRGVQGKLGNALLQGVRPEERQGRRARALLQPVGRGACQREVASGHGQGEDPVRQDQGPRRDARKAADRNRRQRERRSIRSRSAARP